MTSWTHPSIEDVEETSSIAEIAESVQSRKNTGKVIRHFDQPAEMRLNFQMAPLKTQF